ncbi:hypothetical protein AOQ73_05925 [Bradyrhizobium pachyrhizi]|uniref:phage tail protein n=1 Tax=Bradyrhizobium pachyrhizi TaxID=280333 RepID=UPI000704A40B|nr:tail fiber protein [Bradyrhizobium pachyrhizi]KRQ11944.1 hypothetical protein AOQ73_05925 [Bradyrhizobium pachyrhizi]
MSVFQWSQTANSNASADPTVNYAEGQAPSTLNDSARAAMAAVAAYRDDIAGAIVTGGTATAYTLSSFGNFNQPPNYGLTTMSGKMIAFTPHITNGQGPVTLNVDGLGAKALRTAPNVELPTGTIIQGTPYTALYNNTDGSWYLQGFFGNPYNVPLAGGMEYWGSVVPNSSFAFPVGQAISRTTYAALFGIMGTAHGAGDGSTTFNLPDKRGRLSAMIDSGAGRISPAGLGGNLPVMGGAGGAETVTLSTANLPPYTPTGSVGTSVTTTVGDLRLAQGTPALPSSISPGSTTSGSFGSTSTAITSAAASSFSGNAQGGLNQAFSKLPPMICCNYIIRII